MGTQELEIKRAKNMIWAAAKDYSFEPRFIGLKPDGSADEYLNMMNGLVSKWFDFAAIDELFTSFSGKNEALYTGLLWIGLEHAVYEKEVPARPVLEELRLSYAAENLLFQRSASPETRIDLISHGYFLEITGQDNGLPDYERKLLHAFLFPGSMTTEEVVSRTRTLLAAFFSWYPSRKKSPKPAFLLHNRHAFRTVKRVHSGFLRISDAGHREENSGLFRNLRHGSNFLLHRSSPAPDKDSISYMEACFGRNLYSEWESARIDACLCNGNHKNLHLLFTDGHPATPAGNEKTLREIRLYRKKTEEQREKNLAFYKSRLLLHTGSISRLTFRLKNALDAAEPEPNQAARSGRLDGGQVWKALYLGHERVFTRQQDREASRFSVDLMLDASSSRDNWQEQIAAQAYILAESLTACRIPLQIYSFVSVRGYTVLRLFKRYDDDARNGELFGFSAGGNNRDGLALRGASHLLKNAPLPGKILIMLTDASPNDDYPLPDGSLFQKREYADALAVRDTAQEVRALRSQGIRVLGIFMGLESSVKDAVEIFGKDFIKIRDISQFADAAGALLTAVFSS